MFDVNLERFPEARLYGINVLTDSRSTKTDGDETFKPYKKLSVEKNLWFADYESP